MECEGILTGPNKFRRLLEGSGFGFRFKIGLMFTVRGIMSMKSLTKI